MSRIKSDRIEIRISSQVAEEIRTLAGEIGESVSDFARTAMIERAERLRQERSPSEDNEGKAEALRAASK